MVAGLCVGLVTVAGADLPDNVVAAELIEAWPVEASSRVEPSGLAWRDGQLFTVSDDDDETIFRLALEDGVAQLKPAVTFAVEDQRAALDLEGIVAEPDGTFFVVSETHHRAIRVTANGQATWWTPRAWDTARDATLFSTQNAYLEALTRLPDGSFLFGAERQPRGLVQVRPDPDRTWRVEAWRMNRTRFRDALFLPRRPDFTGLSVDEAGRVFALFRNAHLIVELARDSEAEDGDNPFREGRAWSYAHVENDPTYAYRRRTFGMAEGLVVRDGEAHIILDNNGNTRAANRHDWRPQLFHLRLPGLKAEAPTP